MNTPATAARWEGRRLLGAVVALIGLFIGLMPLVATANPPNQVIPNPPPTNVAWTPPGPYANYPFLAGVWDETCDDPGAIDFAFESQVMYRVFVRTGAPSLTQFNNTGSASYIGEGSQSNLEPGNYVAYAQARPGNPSLVNLPPGWPWWHGALNPGGFPANWVKYIEFTIGVDCIPTTTTSEATTTTMGATTTTMGATTTTMGATTTTMGATTTTMGATTTTMGATTTTMEATTTTVEVGQTTIVSETTTTDQVLDSTIVTSTTQPDPELPLTGAFSDVAAWLAMVLVALGVLLITLTRRAEEG